MEVLLVGDAMRICPITINVYAFWIPDFTHDSNLWLPPQSYIARTRPDARDARGRSIHRKRARR
jgi:hypothetical protein